MSKITSAVRKRRSIDLLWKFLMLKIEYNNIRRMNQYMVHISEFAPSRRWIEDEYRHFKQNIECIQFFFSPKMNWIKAWVNGERRQWKVTAKASSTWNHWRCINSRTFSLWSIYSVFFIFITSPNLCTVRNKWMTTSGKNDAKNIHIEEK